MRSEGGPTAKNEPSFRERLLASTLPALPSRGAARIHVNSSSQHRATAHAAKPACTGPHERAGWQHTLPTPLSSELGGKTARASATRRGSIPGSPAPPMRNVLRRSDCGDRDEQLMRMIKRASHRAPRATLAHSAAPDDTLLVQQLHTGEDAIAFFAANSSRSNVKYIYLNPAPRTLRFRPYDLLVVSNRANLDPTHYLMSATGVILVKPGEPSDIVSLAEWIKESSVFNQLTKISFFRNYLIRKTLALIHQRARARAFSSARARLAKGCILVKPTFAASCMSVLYATHSMTDTPMLLYERSGKWDYTVDNFRAAQSEQLAVAVSEISDTAEGVRATVTRLTDVLRRRADVPELNTRLALERYVDSLAAEEREAAQLHGVSKAPAKSMLDVRQDRARRIRELKRGIVELGQVHQFIRLCDLMMVEKLFLLVMGTVHSLDKTIETQELTGVHQVGFQLLLTPSSDALEYSPKESEITHACLAVLDDCVAAAGSSGSLSRTEALREYFADVPQAVLASELLRDDARMLYLRAALSQAIHVDYALANQRLVTYSDILPHLKFLQTSWASIRGDMQQDISGSSTAFHDASSPLKLPPNTYSYLSFLRVYRQLQEAHDAIRTLMSSFVGNLLWVNASKMKATFEPREQALHEQLDAQMRTSACNLIDTLGSYFKQKTHMLNERPTTLNDFAEYVTEYQKVAAQMSDVDATVTHAESLCDLMERQQVEFIEDIDKQKKERTLGSLFSGSTSLHFLFDEARQKAEYFIEENMRAHCESLQNEIMNTEDESLSLQMILSGNEFIALSSNTQPVLEYLAVIRSKLDDVEVSVQRHGRYAELFNEPKPDLTCVDQTACLYQFRLEAWSLLCSLNERLEYWFEIPVKNLDTAEMENQVNEMMRSANALSRLAVEREYADEVIPHILSELQALRQDMSVVHDCGNKHMTAEHWNVVLQTATGSSYTYHDGMNLRTLQEHDILSCKDILAEQSGLATGEWKIGNDINVLRQVWETTLFETCPYKNREGVFILDSLDDVIQQLDDHQIELQTMMASRFVVPVRSRVEKWIHNLRVISEVLDQWITLQKNWMYLEFIFSSDDIKEQLRVESQEFDNVDRLFLTLMSRAASSRNVFRICTEDGLLDEVRSSNAKIDHIQKRLQDYLETKRVAFPRFYFLSNDELLSILSDVRNPKSVQPHLSKCFDSIFSLIFADDDYSEISGMMSGEGERVMFKSHVYPTGSVEQWLNDIEFMMKASLLMHMRQTIEAHSTTKRDHWLFAHPAQCVQAVDMLTWTGQVESAIDAAALPSFYDKYHQQILSMVDLVKSPLSSLQRTLVCTLIVLNVHNRDIVQSLVDKDVNRVSDFAWSQQLRYYWEADTSIVDGMNVGIQHCNVHLWYGYEYLGNQPRLVITPLTDRAFLTCTCALGMNLGAAPQGPAGTGKTESVKDLGKALARQVVVFNCSDGIDYRTMSRMFAGLAQAGAWACFDEFNRIELEVLSVIAQQMLDITTALSSGLERMIFDGHSIRLSPNFGVFITMNPGYAGRTELPDNLKALFRPICMMIPDYALIAEIMFYSEGFAHARVLAQKMVQLYKLSSEQLSKQDHYDFGMRAVKSILVMAGQLKRQNPNENEDMLLIRAMRDSNVPKFIRDDTVLFMALLHDLFPSVQIEEHRDANLLCYVEQTMQRNHWQVVPGMVTKAMQLYDTLVVRHGVMLVGQTLTGKTTIIQTMQQSLTQIKADGRNPDNTTPLNNKVDIHLLNPKSVTMGELYGEVNEMTREWTDGILSDIARRITRDALIRPDRQWVVFDGPVDAVWIENMNTVLDDNKLLCLFNGERIKLPATATFMFEVQDLKVASPATVSRCGMVFLEPFYLDGRRGWEPIARSLTAQRAESNPLLQADRLLHLLDNVLAASLDFIRAQCREWVPSSDIQLARNLIELLDALLCTSEDATVWPREVLQPVASETVKDNRSNRRHSLMMHDGSAPVAPTATGTARRASQRTTVAEVYEPPAAFRQPSITAVAPPQELVPTWASDEENKKMEHRQRRELFDMYFVMAYVWSIGGNLRDDSRARFDTFAKQLLKSVIPSLPAFALMPSPASSNSTISTTTTTTTIAPSAEPTAEKDSTTRSASQVQERVSGREVSLFDMVVHRPSRTFITWTHLVPNFVYRAALPYFDQIVPTAESVALHTLLAVLTSSAKHVLVNGVTGTGKSNNILTFLHRGLHCDDPQSRWESFTMTFSAQTRSRDIEERLESKLYKIRAGMLVPTPGKRAVFFIDDLNMPSLEIYGASPPLELLRQLITQGGFFDKSKTPAVMKEVHEVTFLAACGVPGGGRNEMTMRLTSHFHLLCQPAVSDDSMRRIFGSILYGFFRPWQSAEMSELALRLVDATKMCYQRITREKLPTPARSHYTFNLRDFSKVIQGIMQVSVKSVQNVAQVSRVFVHEVSRVFHDRLIDAADRQWWWDTLEQICQSQLGMTWQPHYRQLLCGDYMHRDRAVYEEIADYAGVNEALLAYQRGYNMEYNTDVQLVFFHDAIQHVSRICRILRQLRGHALLVGMGGTGRQSLCKLSAFMCQLPVQEITITRGFSLVTFRDFVKRTLLDCGCRNKPVVLFLSDAQIVHEAMLEDVNNLLNSGEVPNLMQPEDVDQVVEFVRPLATAAGKEETRHAIFDHFVSLCRDHVHVVLAMSPIGEKLRRRLRMFPSLVNCCTIDWFDKWPHDALVSVAERVLQSVPLPSDALRPRLIELCVSIHLDVQSRSEEFYEELRRRNYTTPTSYLELLTCYCRLMEEREKEVVQQMERYRVGLNTLRSTQSTVDEMKATIIQLQPKLMEAATATSAIMQRVEEEQASASNVRAECSKEEAKASAIQAEADSIRAECQAELNRALPILKAAEDALAELRPDDIREVRSFQKPAARVVLVLEAVLILLGEKDLTWDRAKLVMSRMDFIKDLQNYRRDDLTEKVIRSIRKYVNNPQFQPEEVEKSSKACKSLAIWVIAISNYYDVVQVVAPKRARLVEAEGKVAATTRVLDKAQHHLREIEHQLDTLRQEMEENVAKRERLEKEIELTKVRLKRAEQLMSGLSSEQTRWTGAIATLEEEKTNHAGIVALAAGAVAYLGPFTSSYRERILTSWHAQCVKLGIPIGTPPFDLSGVVDSVQRRDWVQHGLPPDHFSIENGVIVHKSKRWCLCIDPQGQAANWIRGMERESNLRVIKLTEANYMRTLESAVRVGVPVLLENVGESLDAALDPILLRQTYRSQGRLLIRLGDSEVDYDPNFRLYITTKLSNPLYMPEVQIKVTVVNFTVTPIGLENQLLADVVRFEYAELEQRANQTVLDIAQGRSELNKIEDRILHLLGSSTGNILDNEQLVHALQGAKATSSAVTESLEVAESTQRDIDRARNRYRPIAARGAIIYSVLSELSGLDHMYQNSLEFFKLLFVQTLQRTEKADDVDVRVSLLLPAVTLSSYQTVCRGLFEKDKLTFAFLLYAHIARSELRIPDAEWAFLLKGSEGRRYVDEEADPPPLWLPAAPWNEIAALSFLLPELSEVREDLYVHEEEWERWYNSDEAYLAYPHLLDGRTLWHKMLVLKALRDDLLHRAMARLIAESLGPAFTESPAFDLDGCFLDSTPVSPIIFILTPGTDPTQLFNEFAERKGFGGRKFMLSLGQDQGSKAEQMIRDARQTGKWVYLQNCHVYSSWMPTLELTLESLLREEVHADFRLWLTTMPIASFPVLLLQSGVKVVKEPPKGLKANMRDTFAMELSSELWDSCPVYPTVWRRLLFALSYFHAVIQERRRFGPLGWNIPYEWNSSDFAASLKSLTVLIQPGRTPLTDVSVAAAATAVAAAAVHGSPMGNHFSNRNDNGCDPVADLLSRDTFVQQPQQEQANDDLASNSFFAVPWEALRYMVGVIHYGGRVTDYLDNRCLIAMLTRFFDNEVLLPQQYNLSSDGVYHIPADVSSFDAVVDYVNRLPALEDPDLFGLHANADITSNRAMVRNQLSAILSVQPRAKAAAGRSPEEVVMNTVEEFLRRLPPLIDKTKAHPETYAVTDDGTMSSLGTVAGQEIDFYNQLIQKLSRTMTQLRRGIKGEVVMSAELEAMFDSLLLGHVPQMWHSGGYLSRKPLASWFEDTMQRVEFFRDWNDNGLPISFWISGFFFPQGFLTAVLQTYSRQHAIPIDELKFRTTVTTWTNTADIDNEPESGVYMHGLFLEGAGFDIEQSCLAECRKGELYTQLPITHLEPVRLQAVTQTEHTYACPVYKTSSRVGTLSTTGLSTNYVVSLDLESGEEIKRDHWILRGVALLAMLDD